MIQYVDANTPDAGALTTPHRYIFDFVEPVANDAYVQLLDLAGVNCTSGLVVSRSRLDQHGLDFLDRLEQYKIETAERSEWPGTKLWKSTATVHLFTVNVGSIELLKSSSRSISDWYYPTLPEDLCLLRADDTPWFQSTVHEEWAALRLTPEEAEDIQESNPSIHGKLARPRDSRQ